MVAEGSVRQDDLVVHFLALDVTDFPSWLILTHSWSLSLVEKSTMMGKEAPIQTL